MLIYSFTTDYQAFSLRYKDNTTRDKNETKVGKQSANLGNNNEPIQNRLSFLIDCKSVILHHLTILSFPMVRPAWDNWWIALIIKLPRSCTRRTKPWQFFGIIRFQDRIQKSSPLSPTVRQGLSSCSRMWTSRCGATGSGTACCL